MTEVVVVGASAIDLKATSSASLIPETSNPGIVSASPGGVGRNIAETLARLGTNVRLVSRVADDAFGRLVLAETALTGVDVSGVLHDAERTATYVATLDTDGSLSVAVSDFAALDTMTVEHVADLQLEGVRHVVLDANLPIPVLGAALDQAVAAGALVTIEPVSVVKARRLAGLTPAYPAHLMTPNQDEYAALTELLDPHSIAANICVRRGLAGSRLLRGPGVDPVDVPAAVVPPEEVRDVTGAGDSATAGLIHALVRGADLEVAVAFGNAVAARTVRSDLTVPTDLADLPDLPELTDMPDRPDVPNRHTAPDADDPRDREDH
ncbi:MAG: carbohydrate kinase [Actinomycetales bacterium]|nr:carbohydrate kinase family protein [Tetrasphaera sp.]NLW98654.1 carbohydrate kinase [Actinomycetales bacterium]